MDNPVFEENLEIRVSALEGKVEKLSAAMDKFQSFVRDKFATLNIRLARLHHELISQDIRFVEDPNKIKITSSTTSLIVGNVDSTTMDDTSELLVETKKNGIDIVPNYPLLGKRLEVIDYLVFKLPLSVKSREHGSMKMVDGLLNFHIKHGFDCAHKLFVKMPKQKMFSCTSLEFHLEMISLYGTNRFPFDPGIQKIFSCFDIEKRSDETTIRVNSDVWPTEINPRQNKGIEINGCLVGLLEHLLIVFGTMQQYFEKRLVMSEIVYQITRRFDSLHITPRSLDILDSGPAVCGDFVVTLYLQRRGQW